MRTLSFALALLGSANAFFRLPCSTEPIIQARIDPIISPGRKPSNHVHTVHGAKNFALNSTYSTLRASSCTNCKVTQPHLVYADDTENTHDTQGIPNCISVTPRPSCSSLLETEVRTTFSTTPTFSHPLSKGLLVYYLQRGDGDVANGGPGLKAFPEGLKMISGNPRSRSKKFAAETGSQDELRERATKWACLRYTGGQTGYEGYGFPTTDCEAGFQARLHLPSCWDGKNVDSPDHVSHVAYLDRLDNGRCPSTHPVPFIHLFYEVTWDVHDFADRWTEADGWPFVWSTGDATGYSWHGDFQNGWDTQVLQTAIDTCNNPNDDTGSGVIEACKALVLQDDAVSKTCKAVPELTETIGGQLTKLPG
ncbi:hypothetical protein RHS01_06668 [Rhizoctonia solani]|uniref:DUF1996 domain-containing protein n=1 Tax=Rhizoctonia solani TaxID=456999 RepID=A0A8H7M5T2_9AGAM|nr:hypothetical protein RHS01_06668 [Rhizoctonia solani]